MKRATEWRGDHAAVMDHHINYIDRLAKYEDLGMTAAEIRHALGMNHGRWIPTGMSNSTGPLVRCSVCGQYINPSGEAVDLGRQKLEPDFCEKCGAPMDL